MDKHICKQCGKDIYWEVRVVNWTTSVGAEGEFCIRCAHLNGLLPPLSSSEPPAADLCTRRAGFVYDAARLAAIAAKAPVIPLPWFMREPDFRAQFLGVIDKQCGPDRCNSPQILHEQWMEAYAKMGWKYGPEYEGEAKTHPDMVPYEELGQLEQDKDSVFVAMCDIARLWIR
jgi:hypothetical protein